MAREYKVAVSSPRHEFKVLAEDMGEALTMGLELHRQLNPVPNVTVSEWWA